MEITIKAEVEELKELIAYYNHESYLATIGGREHAAEHFDDMARDCEERLHNLRNSTK